MFGGPSDDRDPLFMEAQNLVIEAKKASASFLQRRLKVGYARAARILDELEEAGIIGPSQGSKPRDILVTGSAGVATMGTAGREHTVFDEPAKTEEEEYKEDDALDEELEEEEVEAEMDDSTDDEEDYDEEYDEEDGNDDDEELEDEEFDDEDDYDETEEEDEEDEYEEDEEYEEEDDTK